MPMPKNYTDKEEIERLGWKKVADYKELYVTRDGILKLRIWRYRARLFPCPNCMTDEYVYITIRPSGAYKGCLRCGYVDGPLPTVDEGGRYFAELIEDKEITYEEGLKILNETGQKPPIGCERVRARKVRK